MRSLRVLYVTSRHDAPYRYRCEIPCMNLRSEGIAADILHIRDPRLPGYVAHCSVVVLFRLPWSLRVEAVVAAARTSGARLVFDVDDLVFDPDAVKQLPFLATAGGIARAQYRSSAARLFQTFQACDVFLGATPALARHAMSFEKPAHVWPNLLHPALIAAGRTVRGLRERLQRFPVISYFSGSATHDEDLAMVLPSLRRVMVARPDARLLLCGFLDPGDAFADMAKRVIRVPFVDWRVQPWLIGLSRLTIAPLARIDTFAHAKSALKFFEAGAVGVPTVASPTEPFVEAIAQGRNGYIAPDADGWFAAINTLLDADVARKVGDAARETAIEKHSIAGHRIRLRELFRGMNGRIRHPQPTSLRMPPETPDLMHAPSRMRRRLSRIARARSAFGILRRAGRPEALHQDEASRFDRGAGAPTLLDEEIVPGCDGTEDAGAAILRGLRTRAALFAVFGDERQLREWGAAGFHAFAGIEPGVWQECGYDRRAIVSVPLDARPLAVGRVLVSVAVRTDEDQAYSRIEWRHQGPAGRGKHFIDFPLICDGAMHHYLMTIPAKSGVMRQGKTTLRFEALPVPGAYRLDRIVFVGPCGEVGSE